MHSWHVSASSSLRFVKKIKWLYIRGMWFLLIATLYGRLTDCAFLAYHYLFIVTFREKDFIDCALLACDYLFIVSVRKKDWLSLHCYLSQKRINWLCLFGMWLPLHLCLSRKGFIDCLFFVMFEFTKWINWLCTLGMWLPLHRYVPRERLIDCGFLACDYLFIVTVHDKD